MSYVLIGSNGAVRDLASNAGMGDLRALGLPAAVKEFFDTGVADEELRLRVMERAAQDPNLSYIALALEDLPAPVVLTNGVEEGE